jgi:hypothetical protein
MLFAKHAGREQHISERVTCVGGGMVDGIDGMDNQKATTGLLFVKLW